MNNNTPTNHTKKVAKHNVFVFGEDITAPYFFFFDCSEDKNSGPNFVLRLSRRQNSALFFFYTYGEDEKKDPNFFGQFYQSNSRRF